MAIAQLGHGRNFRRPQSFFVPPTFQPSQYVLNVPSGTTYVFTGTAATLSVGIAPAGGVYTFTGTAATLNVGIAPASGSYTYTGSAATLGVAIAPAGGSYAYTGTPATLGVGIVPASGVYSLTGTAATLDVGIAPVGGIYAFNGTAITVSQALSIAAASGSYALNGTAADFTGPGSTAPAVGSSISGGYFSRKRWHALVAIKRAEQEARGRAEQVKRNAKERARLHEYAQILKTFRQNVEREKASEHLEAAIEALTASVLLPQQTIKHIAAANKYYRQAILAVKKLKDEEEAILLLLH